MNREQNVMHFVIPNEDGSCVLVCGSDDAVCLPKLAQSTEEPSLRLKSWSTETAELCALIHSVFGIDAHVLRMLWDRMDAPTGTQEHILVLDPCHYAFNTAAGLKWLHRDEVEHALWYVVHNELDIKKLLCEYFTETVDGQEPHCRPLWRTRGWLADIKEWTLSVLLENGFDLVGPLAQIRNSSQSSVLRCKVKSRDSDIGLFAHNIERFVCVRTSHPSIPESTMTSKIASVLGAFVPGVLAVNDAKQSVIQLDGWMSPRVEPKNIASSLFQLQHESTYFLEDLKEAGVPERGLDWLAKSFKRITECRSLDFSEHYDVFLQLTQVKHHVLSLISTLEKVNFPQTLVHGHLTRNNVCINTQSEGQPLFTDWLSCEIGFPFLDFEDLLNLGEYGSERDKIEEEYIRQWIPFDTQGVLALLQPVCPSLSACHKLCVLTEQFSVIEVVEQAAFWDEVRGIVDHIRLTMDDTLSESSLISSEDDCAITSYHFVIPSKDGSSILTQRHGRKLSLPKISPRPSAIHFIDSWENDCDILRYVVIEELGLDAIVLRPLWVDSNSDQNPPVVLVLELQNWKISLDCGLEWLRRGAEGSETWEYFHSTVHPVELLQTYFAERTQGLLAKRASWRVPGFSHDVMCWALSSLKAMGLELTEPIQQLRNSYHVLLLGCNIRHIERCPEECIGNQARVASVIAVHPECGAAKFVNALAVIFPEFVPSVINVDPAKGIYMQWDVIDLHSASIDPCAMARTLGKIQCRSIIHVNVLRNAGMKVYSLDWLSPSVERILQNPILDSCDINGNVNRLRKSICSIREYCLELLSLGIPETLVHGRISGARVGDGDDNTHQQFYQWHEARIAHPFCDFAVMSWGFLQSHGFCDSVNATYFAFWYQYGSSELLRRAVEWAHVCHSCINLHIQLQMYERVEVVDRLYIVEDLKKTMAMLSTALYRASTSKGGRQKRLRTELSYDISHV